MIRAVSFGCLALCLAGCSLPDEEVRLSDVYEVCATEAVKLREVRAGMTEAEVERLMGPPYLRIFNGDRYEHESRPHRRETRRLSNGWEVVILYYRARVVHHDSVCSLDETDAVILVNGKVDAIRRGDSVAEFLSKY
jgi:outer membrane protein assembly factor BamE (lipoprotein component of BamABCDE complex)